MTQRLTQTQLAQIIAEVERLKAREEEELDREQVQEILQELNLPPELLDDALTQVQRKQALQRQEKGKKLIVGGVAALVIAVMGFSVFSMQQNNLLMSRVQAQQDRITLTQDNGNNLKIIKRQNNPEVFYRVTLNDAPVGKKLPLNCDWINPSGEVVKQNRYQTREVTTSVWNTYCRYTIPSVAPTGNWQVRILLNNRILSEANFEVQ